MRLMCLTRSPDHAYNPAERGEYHIHDGAQYENMNRAEPVAQPAIDQAERTVAETENKPAKKTRGQEMSRQAQKPKDGNRGEKGENCGGGDKALRGKALQERRVIRNHQPRGKYQSHADAHVNTGADRRVAEDVEPTITGQMRTYQHAVRGSKETSNCSTRIY